MRSLFQALLLLLVCGQIFAEDPKQATTDLDANLANLAAKLGAQAMQPEPRRDQEYLSRALAETGVAGAEAFRKLLFEGDYIARLIAFKALENGDDPKLIPMWRRAFFELELISEREQALAHLKTLDATQDLKADLILLSEGSPQDKQRAAENLVLLGPEAWPLLETFLDADDPALAKIAIEGIANTGKEKALSMILEIQRMPPPLNELANQAISSFLDGVRFKNTQRRDLIQAAYRGSTAGGQEALLRVFKSPVLWRSLNQQQAVDHGLVLEAAPSPVPRIRQMAAAALEHSPNAQAESTLQSLVHDSHQDVRWQAAITLARRGNSESVPLVLSAMEARYRLHPPPSTPVTCGTGHDPYLPAKSALILLSAQNLEDSFEGDAEIWRQWWREVGESFDPIEAQLTLLQVSPTEFQAAFERGAYPPMPAPHILIRLADVDTAAQLMEIHRQEGVFKSQIVEILTALARRHTEVATLLASRVDKAALEEKILWLRILHRAAPSLFEDKIAAWSDAELVKIAQRAPYLTPAFVERLLGLLPESERDAKRERTSIYHRLAQLEGKRYCPELAAALKVESKLVYRLHALQLLTRLDCPGTREELLTELRVFGQRDLGYSFAGLLAQFENPADLTPILATLKSQAPEYQVRTIAMAVAQVLDIHAAPSLARELASPDPERRRGAEFLVRTIREHGWEHPISDISGHYYLTVAEVDSIPRLGVSGEH